MKPRDLLWLLLLVIAVGFRSTRARPAIAVFFSNRDLGDENDYLWAERQRG